MTASYGLSNCVVSSLPPRMRLIWRNGKYPKKLVHILYLRIFCRKATYKSETSHLWDSLRVMVPLETSDPHPFISLLMPVKGKKLLPRLTRHLSTQQLLQVICLLVACFSQLDVVKNAGILDMQEDTPERAEVDRQTQTFLSTVLQSILPVIAQFNLGVVVGMMGLLMEHCDMGLVVHSRVCI